MVVYYLRLAEDMHKRGVLFGVDAKGNPLFADGGEEPIMTDMNYGDTRRAVYSKDKEGKDPTGYEMFPYSGEHGKSPEIQMFEGFTGKPFVKSPHGDAWRASWLESDNNPSRPRCIGFVPHLEFERAGVYIDVPHKVSSARGVRRLLRVKKT